MDESERVRPERGAERKRRFLSCHLEVDGRSHTAVVLDMSVRGLFLRTNAAPAPDTLVDVVVGRPGGHCWKIAARVARQSDPKLHAHQPLVSSRGLGLLIVRAPDAFYEFLETLDD